MDNHHVKKMCDISRAEWVLWEWIFAPSMDGADVYIRGNWRDPSDARGAGLDWDTWRKAYDELEGKGE